jgi:hypothetical protein
VLIPDVTFDASSFSSLPVPSSAALPSSTARPASASASASSSATKPSATKKLLPFNKANVAVPVQQYGVSLPPPPPPTAFKPQPALLSSSASASAVQRSSKYSELLGTCSVGAHVTVVAAHPTLNYAVCGTLHNRFELLAAEVLHE